MIKELVGNPLYDLWKSRGFVKNRWGDWDRPFPKFGDVPNPGVVATREIEAIGKDFTSRRKACRMYSWAVPSPEAVKWIAKRVKRLVEIGAGRGYWAKLLSDAGVDVVAYDESIRKRGGMGRNGWHQECERSKPDPTLWFPVQKGQHEKAFEHSDRTLFMCWPPYDTPMAAECLAAYQGKELLYVGERGGCNGCENFWNAIGDGWQDVGTCKIPQWPGIRDVITIYRRK